MNQKTSYKVNEIIVKLNINRNNIQLYDIENILKEYLISENEEVEDDDIISGVDSKDCEYNSIMQLWNEVLVPSTNDISQSQVQWYSKAYDYWEDENNCPITDDGVLGGYGALTPMDIKGSRKFIQQLKDMDSLFHLHSAADCGAGIGRITKHLLVDLFDHVDLVEQSVRLINASSRYIGEEIATKKVTCICQGLQDFAPKANSYDLIWIQWVIGHLTDLDFIAFFKRCINGLTSHGFVVLKDNCAFNWTFVVDKDDYSVARCVEYIRMLIDLADCEIVHEVLQHEFPDELYPVRMFAIRKKAS